MKNKHTGSSLDSFLADTTNKMMKEYESAMLDALIYGHGFLSVDADGLVTYLPFNELQKEVTEISKTVYKKRDKTKKRNKS